MLLNEAITSFSELSRKSLSHCLHYNLVSEQRLDELILLLSISSKLARFPFSFSISSRIFSKLLIILVHKFPAVQAVTFSLDRIRLIEPTSRNLLSAGPCLVLHQD